MSDNFDRWIDRVLARAAECREKGVLSIGVDGCTVVFAPADPKPPAEDLDGDDEPVWQEPDNPWEDPASYPAGFVPRLEIDDLRDER